MARKNGAVRVDFIDVAPDSAGVIDGTSSASGGESGGDVGSNSQPEPEFIHGFESIEPSGTAEPGTADSGSGSARKRGRPAGSRNTAGAGKTAKGNLGGLDEILYSLHAMGAAFFNTTELNIDESEAKRISGAIQNVAQHYNHTFDPKIVAWTQLCMALGGVYGTRFVVIRRRVKAEAKANVPRVVQMPIKADATGTGPAVRPSVMPDLSAMDFSSSLTMGE